MLLMTNLLTNKILKKSKSKKTLTRRTEEKWKVYHGVYSSITKRGSGSANRALTISFMTKEILNEDKVCLLNQNWELISQYRSLIAESLPHILL